MFIVSAISSGTIRSKLTNQSRAETSQPGPAIVGTALTTFVMVQQPISHPQSLSDADYPPPAYYSTVDDSEGGIPQNAYDYPVAGDDVEEPYYSQALPVESGIASIAVVVNQSYQTAAGHDEPPSYVPIIA